MIDQSRSHVFLSFYTLLPQQSTSAPAKTFIIVPHSSSPLGDSFSKNSNSNAKDEIQAHVEMFTIENNGMYSLGTETCGILSDWLEDARLNEKKVLGSQEKRKQVEDDVRLV